MVTLNGHIDTSLGNKIHQNLRRHVRSEASLVAPRRSSPRFSEQIGSQTKKHPVFFEGVPVK